MQDTAQGGRARYGQFLNAMTDRITSNWNTIGRHLHLQWQTREDEWHAVCTLCGQSVAKTSKGDQGYTWTLGEMLALAVAHCEQCHKENMR